MTEARAGLVVTSAAARVGRPDGDVLAGLGEARALAQASRRSDLVERLDAAAERLRADDATVAVVGEFKQGKSTLVNALLRTDICPVDSDIVTAVPTILRYGRPPVAFLQMPQEDGGLASVPVGFEELPRHIAEGDKAGVRAVEVRLDRRLLGAGLSII